MQRHIACHKRIRPAQRAHGDVLGRPVANAGQGFQGVDGALHISTAMQWQTASHGFGQADDGCLPLPDDAELTQIVTGGQGQHRW